MCAVEFTLAKDGACQIGTFDICIFDIDFVSVCKMKNGMSQIAVLEVGIEDIRSFEVAVFKVIISKV